MSRNVVFSPLCAEIALLMLHAVADDEGKQEVAKILGVDPLPLMERLRSDLSDLKIKEDENCYPGDPEGKEENYRLYLANSLLLPEGVLVDQRFVAAFNQIQINTDILPLQLTGDLQSVKAFLRDRTLGHVCDVQLPPGPPRNATFISTLHFRANWYRPYFREHKTFKMEFVTGEGRRVEVDTMHGILKVPCWVPEGMGGAKFLEVPFEDHHWSAMFIMPGAARKTWLGETKPQTMSELIDILTPARLTAAIHQLRLYKVNELTVQIPKFKVERDVELHDILWEMGLRTPLIFGTDHPGLRKADITQHSWTSAESAMHCPSSLTE
ncbi:serpin A3-1-like [Paramacrobiotus metropolitanus]|uniref:serpin A3-1-like n=1 Tax=Paramacrobiotus metropolitanus TaxID=2943436 RepID=UPI002445FC9F|nr:serpin A3-1-like [Paramacrobiotus metropolitanus]